MIGTQCWLFLILCTTSSAIFSSYPRLDAWANDLLHFSSSLSVNTIINDLEKYYWTFPAIAKFDKWMSKNWIDLKLRKKQYSFAKGRKETRDTMKNVLFKFKASKTYIDYLCNTAIKEGIFKKKDTEKIRGIYWYLQRWYSLDFTRSELFNPKNPSHKIDVDPAGLLKLKEFSEKYLEDEKQKNILKWDYYDDY